MLNCVSYWLDLLAAVGIRWYGPKCQTTEEGMWYNQDKYVPAKRDMRSIITPWGRPVIERRLESASSFTLPPALPWLHSCTDLPQGVQQRYIYPSLVGTYRIHNVLPHVPGGGAPGGMLWEVSYTLSNSILQHSWSQSHIAMETVAMPGLEEAFY